MSAALFCVACTHGGSFDTACLQDLHHSAAPSVQDQLLLKQDLLHVKEVQCAGAERSAQAHSSEAEHWKAQYLQIKQQCAGATLVTVVQVIRALSVLRPL